MQPRSHTIIEAHPAVYKHACSLGWDRKPGVHLVLGRWQDVIAGLGPFDGIFFDTYGEVPRPPPRWASMVASTSVCPGWIAFASWPLLDFPLPRRVL